MTIVVLLKDEDFFFWVGGGREGGRFGFGGPWGGGFLEVEILRASAVEKRLRKWDS